MKYAILFVFLSQLAIIGWLVRQEKKLDYLNRTQSFQMMTDSGRDSAGLDMWTKLEQKNLLYKVINWNGLDN